MAAAIQPCTGDSSHEHDTHYVCSTFPFLVQNAPCDTDGYAFDPPEGLKNLCLALGNCVGTVPSVSVPLNMPKRTTLRQSILRGCHPGERHHQRGRPGD